MLSREQLATVRKIQIRTSHLVSDVFAGQYHSVFKGRGIEFAEVRQYQPGDEVRTIDWNVTARTGVPHVKRFDEERELTVVLLVDASASTSFGSVRQTKATLAAELGAVLAFSAITNNDKVGLVIFSDRIEQAVPPRKGTRHVLRVIREVLSAPARGPRHRHRRRARARAARDAAARGRVRDLRLPRPRTAARALRLAARRHDVIAVVLDDPREAELPDVGLIELEEAETGARYVLDTGTRRGARRPSPPARPPPARRATACCASCGVDTIGIATDRPYTAGAAALLPHAGTPAVRRGAARSSCCSCRGRRPRDADAGAGIGDGAHRARAADRRPALPLRPRRGGAARHGGPGRRSRPERLGDFDIVDFGHRAAGRARRPQVVTPMVAARRLEPG